MPTEPIHLSLSLALPHLSLPHLSLPLTLPITLATRCYFLRTTIATYCLVVNTHALGFNWMALCLAMDIEYQMPRINHGTRKVGMLNTCQKRIRHQSGLNMFFYTFEKLHTHPRRQYIGYPIPDTSYLIPSLQKRRNPDLRFQSFPNPPKI